MTGPAQPRRSANGSMFYVTSMSNRFRVKSEMTFRAWVKSHPDLFDYPPVIFDDEGLRWCSVHGDLEWMNNPSFHQAMTDLARGILDPATIFVAEGISNHPDSGIRSYSCAYDATGRFLHRSTLDIYGDLTGFTGTATSMFP